MSGTLSIGTRTWTYQIGTLFVWTFGFLLDSTFATESFFGLEFANFLGLVLEHLFLEHSRLKFRSDLCPIGIDCHYFWISGTCSGIILDPSNASGTHEPYWTSTLLFAARFARFRPRKNSNSNAANPSANPNPPPPNPHPLANPPNQLQPPPNPPHSKNPLPPLPARLTSKKKRNRRLRNCRACLYRVNPSRKGYRTSLLLPDLWRTMLPSPCRTDFCH